MNCSNCVYGATEWASERDVRLMYCRRKGVMWDSFYPRPFDCEDWISDRDMYVTDNEISHLIYLLNTMDNKEEAIEKFWKERNEW